MAKNAPVSVDQRFALLAAFGANMDWDSLTSEQVQVGITEAQRAGREATLFVQSGCRVQAGNFWRETKDFTVQIPALARPDLAALQAKYDWINRIERDDSPTDALTLVLGTVLREGEERIDGAEYQIRLRGVPTLGYQQLAWLVEHQDEHPAFMALLGQIYVDGPAIIVVRRDGNRRFADLDRLGRRWYLGWSGTGNGLDRGGRVAARK